MCQKKEPRSNLSSNLNDSGAIIHKEMSLSWIPARVDSGGKQKNHKTALT